MNWYLVYFSRDGKVQEWGWMLALDDMELIDYAQTMKLSIDITYLGRANMDSTLCEIQQ